MEQLLEEELKEKKFAEYTKFRDYTAQSLLSLWVIHVIYIEFSFC